MKKRPFILGSESVLTEEVRQWAEALKFEAGIYCAHYNGLPIYLLAAGACSSGGYSIAVSFSNTLDQALRVDYRLVHPNPEDMVIQVITYPYEIILPLQKTEVRVFYNGQQNEMIPKKRGIVK
jgi:hypothetical protein